MSWSAGCAGSAPSIPRPPHHTPSRDAAGAYGQHPLGGRHPHPHRPGRHRQDACQPPENQRPDLENSQCHEPLADPARTTPPRTRPRAPLRAVSTSRVANGRTDHDPARHHHCRRPPRTPSTSPSCASTPRSPSRPAPTGSARAHTPTVAERPMGTASVYPAGNASRAPPSSKRPPHPRPGGSIPARNLHGAENGKAAPQWTDARLDDLAAALQDVPKQLAVLSASVTHFEDLAAETQPMRAQLAVLTTDIDLLAKENRALRTELAAMQLQLVQISWGLVRGADRREHRNHRRAALTRSQHRAHRQATGR